MANAVLIEDFGNNNNRIESVHSFIEGCKNKHVDNCDNSGFCRYEEDDVNANDKELIAVCKGYQSTWNANFPMLDIFPLTSEASGLRKPMDLSSYLLSASPPSSAFDFIGYSTQHSQGLVEVDSTQRNMCPIHTFATTRMTSYSDSNLNQRRNGPLKSIIIKSDTSSDSDGDSCPESPHSPCRAPKKVSFADHKGLALAQVRLVKEGPDEPPLLNPEVLSSLTLGANADVTCKPPIKLCFAQPASDYLAFRDKISKNLVCLENVILRDYSVEGTIKVKNITFEKRVFIRLSLDEWETSEDIDAMYVPGPGLSYVDPYDTFSFKVDISPSFDVSKTIQFAVCFEENGNQHWDNSDGQNYRIVSENYDSFKPLAPVGPVFNPRWLPEKRTDTWSEFSVWRDVQNTARYY